MSEFENALAGDNFADPLAGYAKYIDVNSFVDYFILQEVSKNVDGYRLSTFFYKQRDSDGGKLFMGPIWDFNLGFGNANYCTSGSPEGFVLDFNKLCPDDYWLIPFWWKRLLLDEAFGARVSSRWQELRASVLKEEVVLGYIDSVANVLNAESQARNFTAWNVLNKYVWPNYYVGATFQSEVDWLKGWIIQRLAWLDQNMPVLITATEELGEVREYAVAYPNPFTSSVMIDYSIERPGQVEVLIYDGTGRQIRSATIQHDAAGKYSYLWQGETAGIFHYSVKRDTKPIGQGKLYKK
jgi:hypothetical protein